MAELLVRGWGNPSETAPPELIATAIREASAARGAIVECGSGITTLVLAAARKYLGTEVITLEHDRTRVEALRRRLRALRLHHGGLIHRPLAARDSYDWFSLEPADLPWKIGLIICGGYFPIRGGRIGLLELMRSAHAPPALLLSRGDAHQPMETELWAGIERLGYVEDPAKRSGNPWFSNLRCDSDRPESSEVRKPDEEDGPRRRSIPDPLKIVFLGPEAAPGEGLGQRGHNNEKLSRLLAERGHSVTVLYLGESGQEIHNNVQYLSVSTRWAARLPEVLRRRFSRAITSIEFGWRCRRVLRELAPDVVHIEVTGGSGLLTQLAAPFPTTLWLKGHMPTYNRLKRRRGIGQRVISCMEYLSFRLARSLYASSDLCARLYQVDTPRRIHRLPTPTDPSFAPPAGTPWAPATAGTRFLFFTGTLEEIKGVFVLAEAFRRVVERLPTAELTVIGRDHMHGGRSVRSRMTELLGPAAGRVRWLEFISREELAKEIIAADAVVLPSLFDNLPNALLESLQLGGFVIGTVGSSLDEVIVDGESGLLCRPRACELAEVMVRAAEVEDKARIRRNARIAAESYSPERTVPLLEQHLLAAVRA